MKILPPEQIRSYLTAADQRGVLPMLYLELISGLRKGELVALQRQRKQRTAERIPRTSSPPLLRRPRLLIHYSLLLITCDKKKGTTFVVPFFLELVAGLEPATC